MHLYTKVYNIKERRGYHERDFSGLLTPTCTDGEKERSVCCGREAQCGRQTKRNWTNFAHRTLAVSN